MDNKTKNIKKDILILFIFASGNSIFFSFGAIFPYTFTYCKHFNDTLKLSYFLYNILFIFAGLIIGGYIVPYLFFIFGIKKTMLITAIIYLLQCIFYTTSTSWFYNMLMTLIIGILYQFQICSLNYYLSTKYDNGIQYSSYCYLGQNLNMFITPLIVQYIMNPGNKTMDQVSYGSGDEQLYFNWDISSNYPYTMRVIGQFLLEDLESLRGQYNEIVQAIRSRDRDKLRQIFESQKIEEIKKERSSSLILNKSSLVLSVEDLNQSLENSLIDDQELSDLKAEKLSQKILKSNKFIFLVLLMAFKNGSLLYYANLIKVPVMATLNDDKVFAQSLTISAFADLLNKVISPQIWSKLGFYGTYMLHNVLTTGLFVLILTFKFQSNFFVFFYNSLLRLLQGMAFIYSYNFLYSDLHPKIANFVAKILEANYIIGIVFWFSLNSIIFSMDHLYTNLYFLILINLIVTITFAYNYRFYKIEKHLEN